MPSPMPSPALGSPLHATLRQLPKRSRATLTALVLIGLVLPSCALRTVVLPDESIPHRLSQPVQVSVWVRRADGVLFEQPVSVPAGWWIASPHVVEH